MMRWKMACLWLGAATGSPRPILGVVAHLATADTPATDVTVTTGTRASSAAAPVAEADW